MSASALPASASHRAPAPAGRADVREPSWIVPMLGFSLSLFATTALALGLAAL